MERLVLRERKIPAALKTAKWRTRARATSQSMSLWQADWPRQRFYSAVPTPAAGFNLPCLNAANLLRQWIAGRSRLRKVALDSLCEVEESSQHLAPNHTYDRNRKRGVKNETRAEPKSGFSRAVYLSPKEKWRVIVGTASLVLRDGAGRWRAACTGVLGRTSA